MFWLRSTSKKTIVQLSFFLVGLESPATAFENIKMLYRNGFDEVTS